MGQADPAVREFVRREADVAKGIEHLKASYRGYDEALAPLRDEIRSVGKTEAEAIRMLADWRQVLRGGPTRPRRSPPHGSKASTFLNWSRDSPDRLSNRNPNRPTPPHSCGHIGPISQEVTALKTELQRRDAERVPT